MDVSKEFIRCLEIEHDIMLLENQIKNLTQEKNKLVKELEHLKEQEKVGFNYEKNYWFKCEWCFVCRRKNVLG